MHAKPPSLTITTSSTIFWPNMGYTMPSNPAKLSPPLNTAHLDHMIPVNRAHMLVYALAILALIYHRITSICVSSSFTEAGSLCAILVSDLILAFTWACVQAFRWRPVHRQEFLERLPYRATWPAIDVFVCTADPHKEPPVGVVSTALSAMAFDYPSDKLSVYVSDDGGADVTLFAFMEGAKFAHHWLPFCREKGIKERSPEAYFTSRRCGGSDEDKIRMMFNAMKERVGSAVEKGLSFSAAAQLPSEADDELIFRKWKEFSRDNHPSIIKVLLRSDSDKDITGHVMPNLIYVSREKRPESPHHFKAGALNALARISSVMTNAPIVLTLDCDMSSTDPTSPHRALCYFLDPATAEDLAFVQFPQRFQGLNKNDIYAGEMKRVFRINPHGYDGFSGSSYVGSNTFHARLALFGSSPEGVNGQEEIGSSICLEKAIEVSGCDFEAGTNWGDTIGIRYGSLVEDYYTGYRLHCEGWKSVLCDPPEPAFLGDAPKNLNDVLKQCTRWMVGFYEVGFSRYCPLTFGLRKVSLGMGLCYSYLAFWGIWCIPIATYAVLPQLALINNRPLFPERSNPWFYLYAYLFFTSYIQDMTDFIAYKGTLSCWWSDQRMWLIRGLTAGPFATMQFVFKKLNIAAQGFNVTSKVMDDEQNRRYEEGYFNFGVDSPFFVILCTAAILNLCAFTVGMIRRNGMVVEMFLAGFGVANCWPIYEVMFLRSDSGRMPGTVCARAFVAAAVSLAIGCACYV